MLTCACIMPLVFEPVGPFAIPNDRILGGGKRIESDHVKQFWSDDELEDIASRVGCYIFGIRAAGGFKPYYVGMTTKSFKQEALHSHKRSDHYNKVLATNKRGTPVLFFAMYPSSRRTINKDAIRELESILIYLVRQQNPDATNDKGRHYHPPTIQGVLNWSGRGARTSAAQDMRRLLNL